MYILHNLNKNILHRQKRVEENIDQEKTIDVWTTYEILTNGSRTSKYLYKSFCFWWQDL